MSNIPHLLSFALVSASLLLITACNGNPVKTEAKYPTGYDRTGTDGGDIHAKPSSIFGPEGLNLFGGKGKDGGGEGTGISVNSYLWRASLDTVSFMPLASADPFGGVILTDWYTPEGGESERFKVNVFIMGKELRSDGVRVRIFRQVQKGNTWVDADAAAESARELEDTILTRARQLRVAQIDD